MPFGDHKGLSDLLFRAVQERSVTDFEYAHSRLRAGIPLLLADDNGKPQCHTLGWYEVRRADTRIGHIFFEISFQASQSVSNGYVIWNLRQPIRTPLGRGDL